MNILLLHERVEGWQDAFEKSIKRIDTNWQVHICRRIADIDPSLTFTVLFIHASNEGTLSDPTRCCSAFIKGFSGEDIHRLDSTPALYAMLGVKLHVQQDPKAVVVLSGELSVAKATVGDADIGYKDTDEINSVVVEFLNNFSEQGRADYKLLHKNKAGHFSNQIRAIKHEITHLLMPLDIDLQGWEESGFDQVYGKEIVVAYKQNTQSVSSLLNRVIQLIYDDIKGLPPIIKKLMLDSSHNWIKLQQLIPNDDQSDVSLSTNIIFNLLDAEDLEGLQKFILQEGSTFHSWVFDLTVTLDELSSEVEQTIMPE